MVIEKMDRARESQKPQPKNKYVWKKEDTQEERE